MYLLLLYRANTHRDATGSPRIANAGVPESNDTLKVKSVAILLALLAFLISGN